LQQGVFEEGMLDIPNMNTGKVEKVKTQVIKSCPCGKPRNLLAFWIDAEGVWEPQWAERIGVWTEKVLLMRPTYGEQAYDVITSFVNISEIDLVIIDSLAALTPAVEFDAGMETPLQGVAARMNNRFIRKIIGGMNKAFNEGKIITTWMVNQYRQKIGVMFGDPRTLPGGMGQGFVASLEVEMSPGKITKDKDSGESLFGDFRFAVKKNKVGVSGGSGEYKQCMADTEVFRVGDLMEHEVVVAKAVELGFIERPNQQTYVFHETSYRGISTLVRYLGENPEKYESLKDDMIRLKLGIGEYDDDKKD
jgi:recombination protein RecA